MEIPDIVVKQFQTGEYCADIRDNYFGYGSDEISAVAIAVLEYFRCNHSLKQIVVNGENISVGKLLAGDRLEDSGADEYQPQEFKIDELELDWFENDSGDDYYCVASLNVDDSICGKGVDELSAIAIAIFRWIKDCCDLDQLCVNGQAVKTNEFLGEPKEKDLTPIPSIDFSIIESLANSCGIRGFRAKGKEAAYWSGRAESYKHILTMLNSEYMGKFRQSFLDGLDESPDGL